MIQSIQRCHTKVFSPSLPASTQSNVTDFSVTALGQGACQAIESGFALAQTLKFWKDGDLGSSLQFFQDFRKPRTDRITQSSYETGKLASADIPEEMWAKAFEPEVLRERMRWVMEYDLLDDLAKKLQRSKESHEIPVAGVPPGVQIST